MVGRIFNFYLCCFTIFFVCCSSVPQFKSTLMKGSPKKFRCLSTGSWEIVVVDL